MLREFFFFFFFLRFYSRTIFTKGEAAVTILCIGTHSITQARNPEIENLARIYLAPVTHGRESGWQDLCPSPRLATRGNYVCSTEIFFL